MPAVTVRSRPKGLPIATTASPTSTCVESARESGVRACAPAFDLEQGNIRRGVASDERRLQRVVVREPHLDRGRSFDHVEVGDDVPFLVEHEPGPERLGRLLEPAARRAGGADRRGDLHDPGAAALVDLVHRERGAGCGGGGARRSARLLLHDRGGGARVEGTDGGGSAERHAAAEHGGGGEQGDGLQDGAAAGRLGGRMRRSSCRNRRFHGSLIRPSA